MATPPRRPGGFSWVQRAVQGPGKKAGQRSVIQGPARRTIIRIVVSGSNTEVPIQFADHGKSVGCARTEQVGTKGGSAGTRVIRASGQAGKGAITQPQLVFR